MSGNTSCSRTSRSCRCISPRERPVVERDGTLIMVDDERMPLAARRAAAACAGALPHLGCYPLTGAIESEAATLHEIIAEMRPSRSLRAAGPGDRPRQAASMEKKKQEGYF